MSQIKTTTVRYKGKAIKCVEGQLVVKINTARAKDEKQINTIIASTLPKGTGFKIVHPFDEQGIGLIEIQTKADLAFLASSLERSPDVIYAEPNVVSRTSGYPIHRPADPLYPQR